MKIDLVQANNHRRVFEVSAGSRTWPFPYAKADPAPSPDDRLVELFPDEELGREAFTYRLASGAEGSVHVEQVLEYNQDPGYLRDLLLYRLTLATVRAVEESPLSRREIARRLRTSPAQLYRLLDPTNYRKSVDSLLRLLQVVDREVEFVVRAKEGRTD